ncbi:MAG: leucine--tRNA ligase, partial [Legionellales bacterium]|nr:leucine--tRNA ligase [Legionellales bacterium]
MMSNYQPESIEQQAQQFWQDQHCFIASEHSDQPKFYTLCMFPYPSGSLHIGHVRNYVLGDVMARYQRMQGFNVLNPIGWDAFGLPAENAAIKHDVQPAAWTKQNIANMRQQLQRLGIAYDWSREFATCDPAYYRWEQWLFLQLYQRGLVYKKNAMVNWDPVDQTVLANEQVIDGCGWRSGASIERREISQWFIKITDYADELLESLADLSHWPEQVKTMQRNWIGKSLGVNVHFQVLDQSMSLEVFTTRPDTLMGVTYLAIASNHPLAQQVLQQNLSLAQQVEQWQTTQLAEAQLATMEKHGIDTGLRAIHPITKQPVPIWIANFVLMEYGSGAVMSVPAHDQRDFEFAKQYQLPIKQVIVPLDGHAIDLTQQAFTEHGKLIHSGSFDGMTSTQACQQITEYLQQHQLGEAQTHYRLRDWGVSRQRYWGTPIPMIHCPTCGVVPVPDDQLPVVLPTEVDFNQTQSPLAACAEFVNTTCPTCQAPAKRETDTLDTFVESSWYYARFANVDQDQQMLDERVNYWTPVDHYIGGIEHAVMHLLYARFFHKLLRDLNLVKGNEPFTELLTQGMVLKDGIKMSKSKGNTVDPNALIDRYGADTVRLFVLFAAPPEQSLEWSASGVEGAHRFLKRLWQLVTQQKMQSLAINQDKATLTDAQQQARCAIHSVLQQINYDMQRYQYNTVVSGSMKLFNIITELAVDPSTYQPLINEGLHILLRLLAPITPHLCHALWQQCAFAGVIIDQPWPTVDASALQLSHVEFVVQV